MDDWDIILLRFFMHLLSDGLVGVFLLALWLFLVPFLLFASVLFLLLVLFMVVLVFSSLTFISRIVVFLSLRIRSLVLRLFFLHKWFLLNDGFWSIELLLQSLSFLLKGVI